MKLDARIYRQFDADPTRDIPAGAYGGWKRLPIEIAPQHTALVVMHAWDCGGPGEFPGWERAVEYISRAREILRTVFPRLLSAVRRSPLPVFHVAGGGVYHRTRSGFMAARELAGASPVEARVAGADPVWKKLQAVRASSVFPGDLNQPDVARGLARLDFAPESAPVDDEPIVEDSHQLAAVCRARGINHLVYTGFAINWCLLMSPGGMSEMARRGAICSTIAEAITAVENRETARDEREKAQALWRVAVAFGFVFELEDFLASLPAKKRRNE